MEDPVIADTILGELNDLWTRTGQEAGSSAGVLRACTMTLVILCGKGEDHQALGETVAALMPEHPARTILVKRGPSGANGFDHRVYAQCWMPFGQRRQICCEQIEITSNEPDVARVVAPLVAPDLPVVLWVRDSERFLDSEFDPAAFGAGKLIVDSFTLADTPAAAKAFTERRPAKPFLADLAWTRITRWREMLSRIFENRDNLARLSLVNRIRIWHGGEAAPLFAWYMGAWLTNSLADAGVKAELNLERDAQLEAGTLRIELAGEGFDVMLERREERLVVRAGGLSLCTNLSQPSDYVLMREELGILREDPVFERTLDTASHLSRAAI
jgi:glucose-6-phosphate dehydrogenase assembly protein OpcA